MSDTEDRREYLLSALRVASARARMCEAEINSIGVALKGGIIDCYTAMEWIKEIGALELIRSIPTKEEVGPVLGSDK